MEATEERENWLWNAVKELDFVTAFFTWLFMALSRLAEPLMTLSALYVIIQTGVPVLHNGAVYNTAIACMLGAPEIILPGAFVLAGKEHARGNVRPSYVLYTMACLFVVLTLATLGDLFMFHLSGQWLNALMFARCAVSVGYSIIFRIISHTPQITPVSTTIVTPVDAPQPAIIATIEPPQITPNDAPTITPEVAQEPPMITTEEVPVQATKTRRKVAGGRQQSTTEDRVTGYRRRHPDASQREMAQSLGISLRTVQRYDNKPTDREQARLRVVQ